MGNCCKAASYPDIYSKYRTKILWTVSSVDMTKNRSLTTSSSSLHPQSRNKLSVLDQSIFSSKSIHEEYHLGAVLGRGEFGVTRTCTNLSTSETLACKSISKRKLKSKVDIADVRREVEIMRSLPIHPNIVRFREAYEDEEAVHLVMEMCAGGELFDRIVSRGHYTEREAAVVFKTVVEVVEICHGCGVMHRDLKPENFLFESNDEASKLKAIDFGLSVLFKPGQRFHEVVGSPYYMAPEVLKRNYGPEIDIWSAGVILYILLCGVPPFWAETDEGIARAILRSIVDFDKEPWPKVSKNAKDLVRSMLDPNPWSRMTARQVLDHQWLQNIDKAPDISLGEGVRDRLKQFLAMNKFKKQALRVVAENLPVEEVAGIKEMFDIMDTDKNGNLTLEELKEGFQFIGSPVVEPDIQMLLEAADMDGNGTLDCDEFVTVSVHLKKINSEEHLLSKAFKYFDKNDSGYIEIDELRETLMKTESHVSDQIMEEIILDVDKDKDGRISYEEFTIMMNSGMNWRNGSRQFSRVKMNSVSHKLFKIGSSH